MLKNLIVLIAGISCCIAQPIKIPEMIYNPEKYICYYTSDQIVIDGVPGEKVWNTAEWARDFVDIKGRKDFPVDFHTRVKMLWDKNYFYVLAELEENDIWGDITKHDDTIYNNNNFEVFIDPDGDTHNYFELEMNALNTTWDLFMIKPYSDMEKASLTGWEMKGLKTCVKVHGTLNKPGDKDTCWTVEAAFPWSSLREITETNIPPLNGDQWRINFARAEWKVKATDSSYIKMTDSITNKQLKNFSTWSPQGIINMHYPEMWGYVQFETKKAGNTSDIFINKKEEAVKWYLRKLYYQEKIYYDKMGKYTSDISNLDLPYEIIPGYSKAPEISCTPAMYEACSISDDNSVKVYIKSDGKIIVESLNGTIK
jgi:hypothetical protein